MERESFIFYRSFYEAVDGLPLENQAHIYKAIASYALNGDIIELNQWENALFMTIRPQLDANQKRFENGCKGAEFGKLGGAPKGNQNAKKQPQINPKSTPNVNVNVNDNENKEETTPLIGGSKEERKIISASQGSAAPQKQEKKFVKPTLEEVEKYCEERNNAVDPKKFMDHYTANGWRVGRSPMKDWRAAVRTWEKTVFPTANQGKTSRASDQMDLLKKMYAEAAEEERLYAENNGN